MHFEYCLVYLVTLKCSFVTNTMWPQLTLGFEIWCLLSSVIIPATLNPSLSITTHLQKHFLLYRKNLPRIWNISDLRSQCRYLKVLLIYLKQKVKRKAQNDPNLPLVCLFFCFFGVETNVHDRAEVEGKRISDEEGHENVPPWRGKDSFNLQKKLGNQNQIFNMQRERCGRNNRHTSKLKEAKLSAIEIVSTLIWAKHAFLFHKSLETHRQKTLG